MIPPDREIFDVEQRIAARRAQLAHDARQTGRRALQSLTSPVALIAAAGLGFVAARAFAKREPKPKHPERRKADHMKAAKATGLVGTLLPVLMWVVRAQWGSPAKLAHVLLEKFQQTKAAPSPRGDKRPSLHQVTRP
jgi:hypothetical protein